MQIRFNSITPHFYSILISLNRIGAKCLLCFAVLMASSAVSAANCKGQPKDLCDQSASCSWVDSYERKDGRVVKGFCRAKAKGFTNKSESSNDRPVKKAG